MKKFKLKRLVQACAMATIATGGMMSSSAFAQTAAGVEIKNLATVTYEDENGNTYSAQSNESVVTVKQVYSAEMGIDVDTTAAAGQMKYIQHTLTNTGNGMDTYTLVASDLAGDYGDTVDADSIKIFHDKNENGQADSGEDEISSVTLDAGESIKLVVAVEIPSDATTTDNLAVKLEATTANGTVSDATSGKGRDGADGTNETLISVTGDAVLNFTKSAVHDEANNQITYTLVVTNTGNKSAKDVLIFDGLPSGTTFVSASVSGILASNGDTVPTAAVALDETALGVDLNANGSTTDANESALGIDLNTDGDTNDTGVQGIFAKDAELAANSTVSVTFVVAYDPMTFDNNGDSVAAGDIIKNIAFLTADVTDTGTPEGPKPTNPTETEVPQLFGVDADDTEEALADSVNDGKDDDGDNDSQFVSEVPAGSTVLFNVDLTNQGNGNDTFELSIDRGTFPVGTTFTFWNADGTVQLTDTNGKTGVDTANVAQNATSSIQVKAKLPSDQNGDNSGAGFVATLTGTSAADPATTPISDTVSLTLGAITAPAVDLDDDATNAAATTNADALSNPGEYELTGRAVFSGDVGGTIKIPLYIDNDSGSSDSFQLAAGSQWNGSTLGGLPSGWDVAFYEGDDSGNPVGNRISSTDLLPGGKANYEVIAIVTLPNDPAYALANFMYDNDADATDEKLDPNSDGDGDYPIFFQIISANSGASDIMIDAVDVNSIRELSLTPPGANQIQPGGSVDYTHKLDNVGNTDETVELSATNSQPDGWSNTLKVDTNCDGTADTTLGNLSDGGKICGLDKDGNSVEMTVSGTADGKPDITIPAGVNVELVPTVFSPSSSPAGQTDVLTVSVDNKDGTGPSTTVEDNSTVILGQVRMDKTAAYDANCDGEPDGAFEKDLSSRVAPGECAVWQIKAENQGDAVVKNVIITDAITSFADFLPDSLRYCLTDSCTPAQMSDTTGNDAGEVSTDNVTFYVGTGADASIQSGGDMVAGEKSTVRFAVKVK